MKTVLKILIIFIIIIIWISFYYFGGDQYLAFSALKEQQLLIQNFFQTHPIILISTFCLIYIGTTAVSIPGATILTLTGGFLFGSLLGTLVIAVSATIGATLAFLSARFIVGDFLEKRYSEKVAKFNKNLGKNAFNYLLFLRLVPLFPFFLINIGMGLTRIRISIFALASFIGMIPGTFIYCNAGSQLAKINSLKEIASPNVLFAFFLLGCLALVPVIYKKTKGISTNEI